MRKNFITQVDSYKIGHAPMYPKGTEYVYSYLEARTGGKWNKTLFFELQYQLIEYLEGEVITQAKLEQALPLLAGHLSLSEKDILRIRTQWEHIINKHNGRLPLEIKAVPEGTLVPINNVLMTVVNTDPDCFWLTNYVETLLTHVWYGCNIATLSYECKKIFEDFAYLTSTGRDVFDFVQFQLHDFGYRSATCEEAAGIGGAGHLVNFLGTDTINAMEFALDYYNCTEIPAFSVPATEHSVMTSMGKEGEEELFRNLLKEYPTGILSVVIDSYDYKNFIKMAGKYKKEIFAREGKVVFRPDSGEPTSTSLNVIELLAKEFGYTENEKGYKVLNPSVGTIWGDGIDISGIEAILANYKENFWASSNICFGMGSHLLQVHNRDTCRYAFKCSAQKRNGVWYDIFKSPLDQSKVSKKGKLKLVKLGNTYQTIQENGPLPSGTKDELVTVFKNGVVTKKYTFDEVRANTLL